MFKVPSTLLNSLSIKIGDSKANALFNIISGFSYSSSSIAATQNSTNISITVSNSNTGFLATSPSVFTVSPSLPAGLTMDSSNGKISGVPTGTTGNAYTTYTVKAIMNNESQVQAAGSFKILVATAAETTNRTCNTSGIASGCYSGAAYSCTSSSSCYSSYSSCLAATACGF